MSVKQFKLIGRDGKTYLSKTPGKFGGHRGQRVYGRLDCPSALRWIDKGYYIKERVFFKDANIAVLAGYRPCAICLPEAYEYWKEHQCQDSHGSRRGRKPRFRKT